MQYINLWKIILIKQYYFRKKGKPKTGGSSGTNFLAHRGTFWKLGSLTTTHPSYKKNIKKVPGYFSNFAKKHPPPPFLKKSTRVLFRIFAKNTPTCTPLWNKKVSGTFLSRNSSTLFKMKNNANWRC